MAKRIMKNVQERWPFLSYESYISYFPLMLRINFYYYSKFNSFMGNQCDGSNDRHNREFQQTLELHRKVMEDYERKIKESQSLLTSRIENFNQQREKFEHQRLSFQRSRKGSRKGDQSTTIIEEDQQNSQILEDTTSGRKVAPQHSLAKKGSGAANKLCDFQFIVNYHLR